VRSDMPPPRSRALPGLGRDDRSRQPWTSPAGATSDPTPSRPGGFGPTTGVPDSKGWLEALDKLTSSAWSTCS
jgi:hypothetical protein